MNLTLIVEDNIQLQDFYHLNLYTWVGTGVIRAANAKFALEELAERSNEINLIITRVNIKTEKTFDAIQNYLDEHNLKIPIITLGATEDLGETNIPSGIDIKLIVKAAAKSLGVTAESMAALQVEEHFAIPIQHFNHLTFLICEVFDGNNEQIYATDEMIDPLKLKNDVAAGTQNYYVKRNSRLKFVSNFNEVIASKLNLLELNKDEKIQAVELSQNLLRENLEKFGVTEENIELASRNLKEMVQNTKQTASLLRFIKRLLKNKCGFHFKHTQVLMFVAAHLMDHLDWGTEEQKEKLQFIAYFHDIALENDEQARIHSNEELMKSDIPAPKKELVKKHALLAASLVAQYPNAPMGVEQIIKQHHGSLNGVGFSEHFSQNISPMAIVLILAEDFVTDIIERGRDFSVGTKVAQMREKYTTQRFKKILDVLETITA